MLDLTDEQYAMLERLERGFCWKWFKCPEDDEVLHFLMEKGLCEAREDIAENLLVLTQQGKAYLEMRRKECAESEKQATEKEKQASADRLAKQKMTEDAANKATQHDAEKSADRRFQLLNTLVGATLGVLGTLLVQWLLR